MSEIDWWKSIHTLQSFTMSDSEAWKAWQAQGQSWRTEPEIDGERQKYLTERRSIKPDIEQGIYPFKDIKLNRADVEWLLATHENERGPVDWKDESQRKRKGLDLRGADLSQAYLIDLPLTYMQGGLTWGELGNVTEEQTNTAAVRMRRPLTWGELGNVTEEQTNTAAVRMQGAHLAGAQLQGAYLPGAQLQGAYLTGAQLQQADLTEAQLQQADLGEAQLQGADLGEAQLQGANLTGTQMQGANLYEATLSDERYGPAILVDITWSEVNLAVVDWTLVKMLGNERLARQTKAVGDYQVAVRANRQLAVVLRNQGLNEEADRFAYQAQVLQRQIWQRQHRYLKYLGSGFLWLLAGHGYRPLRSVLWYLVTILEFALAYYTFGHLSLWPPDAFVYSLTSFHGRGFFPGLEHRTSLHDPLVMLAAIEAMIGLFIEISFIATFTQRFFGR